MGIIIQSNIVADNSTSYCRMGAGAANIGHRTPALKTGDGRGEAWAETTTVYATPQPNSE